MTRTAWSDTGDGPVVVLLHAFPCNHRMWDAQVSGFVEDGWRVLVPDLPGFGASPLPDGEPALSAAVDLIVADLLELGIDRLVVAGLSVGGYLVMEWLRRYPEMLAGVALCDTKATADAPDARSGRLAMAESVLVDPARTGVILRERMLGGIVGATTHGERPDVLVQVEAWMDAVPAQTVAWYQQAMAARPDSLTTLAECEIPSLVLWGDEDTMSDDTEQRRMLEALPDVRDAKVPRAGHLSAIENPGEVTKRLVSFAAEVRRTGNDG